jgi:hypothetical protein
MTNLSVLKSTQFKINELVIVTKAGKIDISGIYEEINIFDSILMPVMSGNILITDSVGLSSKLFFDGSESLLIDIVKDENSDIGIFKKAFRIYSQSNRKNVNSNSEKYILKFVSDELMYSDQQKVNQSYENTYSEIVKKILIDYLKVSENNLNGLYHNSKGIKKVVIPNLRPFEAIEWCAKRSVDERLSPNFIFFQNNLGYNYASLSILLTQPEILDIKFTPKNLETNNLLEEITFARSMEVIKQTNNIEKTRSGVNAGRFIGFDPMTRVISNVNVSYGDHFYSMKHGNENPNISVVQNRDKQNNDLLFNSKKVLSSFEVPRQFSNYIKKYDPTVESKRENIEDWYFQRKSILNNLTSKRIKLTMPGNFQLTSGFNVNVTAPNFSIKEDGSDNEDSSISGKYLIVATRHIIGYEKHETIIEVASSSSANEFIPVSSAEQTQEILDY